jgi:putative membrane protein
VPPLSAAAFVDQALKVNLFEIEASKVALERLGEEQLVSFASQMVLNNAQVVERLAGGRYSTTRTLDPEHMQILADLRQSEGVLLAKRYVREQVRAHQQAIQLYERYAANGTDQSLRDIAAQALSSAREQLRTATLLGERYLPGY